MPCGSSFKPLLLGIGHADADPNHSPEKRAFWDRVRPLMGKTSRLMLSLLDDQQDDDEEETQQGRRSKHDIVRSICELKGIPVPKELKGSPSHVRSLRIWSAPLVARPTCEACERTSCTDRPFKSYHRMKNTRNTFLGAEP